MKTRFLLLSAVLVATHPLASLAEPVAPTPGGSEIKLSRAMIPNVYFDHATLGEGLEFVAYRTNELSKEPGKINFLIEDPGGLLKDKQVAWLKMRNVPAKVTLQYLLTVCEAKARYDAHAIVISPRRPGDADARPEKNLRLDSAAGKNREAQLARMIIPSVDFENVSLQEGLEYLGKRDKESDKDPGALNFVVEDQALLSRQAKSLKLKNVPVTAALQYLLRQCGAEARYDAYAVAVIPLRPAADTRSERERTIDEVMVKSREAQLSKVVIPKFHLEDATLEEAIALLAARIGEAGDARVTANFVVEDPGEGLKTKRIKELKLSEVPAKEALQYILQQCNAKARYEEYAIVITP